MVKQITDQNFENEVLKSKIPVICDFWAPWCGPCKIMGPIFDEVSEKFSDKVKFVKINVDENPKMAEKYNVMSIPTLIIFKDKKEADRSTGLQSKESLKEKINQITVSR